MPQRAKNIAFGSLWLLLAAWLFGGLPSVPGLDSAPFPADKLTVVVVRESQKVLPKEQNAVIYGEAMRDVPQRRIYDPDQSADKDAPWAKPALEAIKASGIKPPVLGVSNGRAGTIVPLPANEAEFAALLQKYR